MKKGILQSGCAGNQKSYIFYKLRNVIFFADVLVYAIVPVFPPKIQKQVMFLPSEDLN
jgi:hypothetical protein